MTCALATLARLFLILLLLDVIACVPIGGTLLSNMLNLITITTALLTAFPDEFGYDESSHKHGSREGKPHNKRTRRSVSSIFCEQGCCCIRRAHRMHARSFWKLLSILQPHMKTKKKSNEPRGAPNGFISPAARLSSSLRCFAGGRPDDIALVHGISHSAVFESAWEIVDAANGCPELEIKFPADHTVQKQIAAGFRKNSKANFNNVVGAIDGMMVWTERPQLRDCESATVGPKKFFCGHKKTFGLNM